jgi:hypothetical protein
VTEYFELGTPDLGMANITHGPASANGNTGEKCDVSIVDVMPDAFKQPDAETKRLAIRTATTALKTLTKRE